MDLDPKAVLHAYLDRARDAMVWKVQGLGEYDVRRPLTPTGTNLLGLVKHLAGVELDYFGTCCGRPPKPAPGETFAGSGAGPDDGPVDNEDMWAHADESVASVLDRYRRAREHADRTIAALDLDSPAEVPWWPEERRHPTLQVLLVHMVAETSRHAGHADIVRELVDGEAGLSRAHGNLPAGADGAAYDWVAHRARVEAAAREAAPD